jgi:hypothetical protein
MGLVGVFKLLFYVFIILAIWSAFRFFQRLGQAQDAIRRGREAAEGQAARRSQSHRATAGRGDNARGIEAEDMIKCRVCGAYVAARGVTRCERRDCPW